MTSAGGQSWFQSFDFFTSVMTFTPKLTFSAACLTSAATWLTSAAAFKAIKVIKYAKKRPKSSQQLHKFFTDVIVRNQLFGSFARSDLQAINYRFFLVT